MKPLCAHSLTEVPTLHSGRLPRRRPLWRRLALRGGGTGSVEDFRCGWGEQTDAGRGWGGGGRGEGDHSRLGSGGGGDAGGWRRRLRCRGFGCGGLPPALQGVEGDPARLRLGLGAGRALLLLWGGDAGRLLGGTTAALRRGRLGRVRAWRRGPWRLLALLVHAAVWGEDLEDGRLLQRSPQLPRGEAQEGAVAVCGRHGQEGAVTRPVEGRRRERLLSRNTQVTFSCLSLSSCLSATFSVEVKCRMRTSTINGNFVTILN